LLQSQMDLSDIQISLVSQVDLNTGTSSLAPRLSPSLFNGSWVTLAQMCSR
jgi:hypothetical protein